MDILTHGYHSRHLNCVSLFNTRGLPARDHPPVSPKAKNTLTVEGRVCSRLPRRCRLAISHDHHGTNCLSCIISHVYLQMYHILFLLAYALASEMIYNFTHYKIGMTFGAGLVGSVLAMPVLGFFKKKSYELAVAKAAQAVTVVAPEKRLYPVMLGVVLLPISMFRYMSLSCSDSFTDCYHKGSRGLPVRTSIEPR